MGPLAAAPFCDTDDARRNPSQRVPDVVEANDALRAMLGN